MATGASLFALLAGVLSTLSPCVLPLLPLVLGAAVSEHRLGPAALAAGLAVSFVAIGLFVATIGFSIGLDAGIFRGVAALLLLAGGVVLMVPRLQQRMDNTSIDFKEISSADDGGHPRILTCPNHAR